MRAIFFGTPDIAVHAFEALMQTTEVVAVVCQPDRPAGRGLAVKECMVKCCGRSHNVPIYQPSKVRTQEFADWVKSLNADFALVMAYGRILTPAVLSAPRLGCLNLHASILPKYRGAAPITWSVVNGEAETGIALMQMDEGMDTGPVFCTRRIPIGRDETAGELSERLAALAADVVREDLPRVLRGELMAVAQDHSVATYAKILDRSDGQIPWDKSAQAVHDHVRGMSPWPGAYTHSRGKMLKVHKTAVHSSQNVAPAGTLVIADSARIVVACGQGTIELLSLQLEGRKVLTAREMVAGRGVQAGDVLGPKEQAGS